MLRGVGQYLVSDSHLLQMDETVLFSLLLTVKPSLISSAFLLGALQKSYIYVLLMNGKPPLVHR